MPRIDCSVTVNFLSEWERMCSTLKHECMTVCPLNRNRTGFDVCCDSFIKKVPDTAVEIVQKWSDEYPQKTRLDDAKEKYKNLPLESGVPLVAPWVLGYCAECEKCSFDDKLAPHCWHEPLEGGATGKAVE